MVEISVVLPLYNKAPFIIRALDSIAVQTFDAFEVIVVDDGSTDGSAELAAAYPDARFRIIKQGNSGPGAARNRGIAEAKAELIAFLDGDDEWLPRYLSDAVVALRRLGPEVATVTCSYIEYPQGISMEGLWRKRGIREGVHRVDNRTSPELLVSMLAFMSPWSTVARASVLRKWDGFYAQDRCVYGEDSFLWLKILLNESVAFELRPGVKVHREAANLSKNLRGPRPLEPFLRNPGAVEAVCPHDLRGLLSRLYTIRAFKTACVWGYWGEWQPARALRRRFRTQGDYSLPYYVSSLVCSTPIGALLVGALLYGRHCHTHAEWRGDAKNRLVQ